MTSGIPGPTPLPESHLDSSMVTSRLPERVTWAVDQLRVRPTDHVLEIGCGSLLCLVYQPPRGSPIDRVVDGCSRHLHEQGFKRVRSHTRAGAPETLVCISAKAART